MQPTALGVALRRAVAWLKKSATPGAAAPSDKGGAALRPASIRRRKAERARLVDPEVMKQVRALADPDPAVRALALQVISEFSKAQAAELIAAALFDLAPSVRCVAAACAVRVGASRVVPALIAALEDREPEVRAAARSALEAIVGSVADSESDLKKRGIDARLADLRADSN